MLDRDYKKIRRRIWLIASVLFVAFIAIGVRAFTLQVVEGDLHHQKAQRQTIGSVDIKPRRGNIYDRKMNMLVGNRKVQTLVARPRIMREEDHPQARALVKEIFGSDEAVLQRFRRNAYEVFLERHISEELAEKFDARIESLPKEKRPRYLALVEEDKRFYPFDRLAAPILGYTDIDLIGKRGLEYAFDKELRGKQLKFLGQKDASGKVALETLDLTLKVPTGKHLVLTIDKGVQHVAERVLRDTVETHRADHAFAIIMDPKDGAIFGMAQYPSFDPNRLLTRDLPNVNNFAATLTFEPGSTLKPFITAQALESARFVPDDMIDCAHGRFRVGPKIIRDVKPYGALTVSDVLVKSSNIGMTRIAQELGAKSVYEALIRFGFGVRTGIPMRYESRGIINASQGWHEVDLANAAFGQGVNVTGLQLIAAFAAFANGGILVQPRLVYQELHPDGEVAQQYDPVALRRVMSETTARAMHAMLRDAASDRGTGLRAQIAHCPVAGKTGTAEKLRKNVETGERKHWTSSFAGYLPADDPQLVILVVVDEPKGQQFYGGEVAAPAFRKIAAEVAPLLGICAQRQELAEAL